MAMKISNKIGCSAQKPFCGQRELLCNDKRFHHQEDPPMASYVPNVASKDAGQKLTELPGQMDK